MGSVGPCGVCDTEGGSSRHTEMGEVTPVSRLSLSPVHRLGLGIRQEKPSQAQPCRHPSLPLAPWAR